jgi:3-oxoacyl-[acyl-carrier-protein] synthase-3
MPVHLRGPRYELGEIEADHTSIEGLRERAEALRMPPDPGLWGWGTIRRTERSLEELAVASGIATLRAAQVPAGSVDALVLCSTGIPGPAEGHGTFVETVATGIGLGDIPFYGQTLNRCLNLLAALDVASAFVAAGRHERVLVITTDRIFDETERMTDFALFSDGAASCLVTGDPGPDDYELLGCATAQQMATLAWSNELSSDLSRQVNDRLLTPLGLKTGDLDGLMHANLYKPLVTMKERQAGFAAAQLFPDNIVRIGHSFAADPLINLVDQQEAGRIRTGGLYLLAASVPGSRIGVLLRRLAP